jgi:GNAT-family acetyltransferase (TIGR03103 family)
MATNGLSRQRHRLERHSAPSLMPWDQGGPARGSVSNAAVDCGWGRLLFAHTFESLSDLVDTMREEAPGQRDIAIYLRDPHVALSMAPHELFLDPSHTYRLSLSTYRPGRQRPRGFAVRRLRTREDANAVRRILACHGMVPIEPGFLHAGRNGRTLTFFVAADAATGAVVGSVMGVDHERAFDDPEHGSSLWSLAVDPQAAHPGIGERLVRTLAEHYQARGRAYMDLSVLHDNAHAIALYERIGFQRVPAFALKTKNSLNERLFSPPAPEIGRLNPYARIIVNEALRRGIGCQVADAEAGFFTLTLGGRSIMCRESLSELTTAVAMSRCDDKAVTRRVLEAAGLRVPAQRVAGTDEENEAFLGEHGALVVKPARGEQGRGITVDVRTPEALSRAVSVARAHCETVLLEQLFEGQDLRVVVVNYEVVAAAIRRPAQVTGNGTSTVAELIEAQSRRRAAATGGESRIPLDAETERCVLAAGRRMDEVLAEGEALPVRKTANLHTGGTIHDVTDELSPALAEAAVRAARAIPIPVVGLDFLVPSVGGEDYVIIEANERPGLANHEPRPTAERFVDLLFPSTAV